MVVVNPKQFKGTNSTSTALSDGAATAVTPEYKAHDWNTGETISEKRLDAMEQGIEANNKAVRNLESASVAVNTLTPDATASAEYNAAANTYTFNLPQGAKGEKGEKGDIGPTGATGERGESGPQGPKGATGDQGLQGPKGEKGDEGEKGDAGEKGANGASIRIASTSVTEDSTNALSILADNITEHPVAVDDVVLDATNKKLYVITAVDESDFIVGAAVATLP